MKPLVVYALIVIIILAPVILLVNYRARQSDAAWHHIQWKYRKLIPVNNSGSALTDFQVPITVDTATLISAGKMQSDCDDIRMVGTNGSNYSYWFSGCNTASTVIWSKIDSIPTTGTSVYLYYGNTAAAAGKATVGTAFYPGLSCKSILDAGNSTGTGVYRVDTTNGSSSDSEDVYCDMTNNSGGWMLVKVSMIASTVLTNVTRVGSSDSNGGSVSSLTHTETGCGGAESAATVQITNNIQWDLLRTKYTFSAGAASCWSINSDGNFGGHQSSSNMTAFSSPTDTLQNCVLSCSTSPFVMPPMTRCDNAAENFALYNSGSARSFETVSRRVNRTSVSGPAIGLSCNSDNMTTEMRDIYIKETSLTYSALSTGTFGSEEQGTGETLSRDFFNDEWMYRQRVPITSGSSQTDYQIPIILNTTALITAGKMNPGCTDVRVVAQDGKILPHWIEKNGNSGCNNTTTKIWAKVTSINTTGNNIYVYYGNPSAEDTESGKDTFMYFDDFNGLARDPNLWTVSDASGHIAQLAGYLNFNVGSSAWNQAIWLTPSIARGDVTFEVDFRWTSGNAGADHIMMGWKDDGAGASYTNLVYALYLDSPTTCTTCVVNIYEDGSGRGTVPGNNFVLNTNHKVRMRMRASGGAYFDLSSNGGQTFSTTYTSTYSTESTLHPGWSLHSGNYEADNFFVRKDAATPPVVGSLGAEETNGGPIVHLKFDEGAGTVAVNSASGISGYLSSQSTSFGSGVSYGTGTDGYMVATGDLNRDSKIDMVVSNNGTSTVSVLYGNGDGTFASKQDYSLGIGSPYGVAIKDVDNDNWPDIAVGFHSGTNVIVLYNTGTSFTAIGFSGGGGTGLRHVDLEDINNDGLPDMIISNLFNDIVTVRHNYGGLFTSSITYATGDGPYDQEVVDVNNDGFVDIITADINTGRVSVLLNDKDGTFGTSTPYGDLSGASNLRSISTGDVNNDGYIDIVAGADTAAVYQVFLNDGDGTFPSTPLTTSVTGISAISGVVLGEITGDGHLDLLVQTRTSSNTVATDKVYVGNGDGTFTFATDYTSGPVSSVSQSIGDIVDVNGDGKNDLLIPNMSGTDEVVVFLNTRTTATWEPEENCISSQCLKFDGTNDSVSIPTNFSKPNALTTSMWFRTGSATYMPMVGFANTAYPKTPTSHVPTLVMLANGKIRSEYWNLTAMETAASYNDNKWHHISFVGAGSTQTLYIDGKKVGSGSGTIDHSWWTTTTVGSAYVTTGRGAGSDTWAYFNGFIDEFKIYPYALTEAEIKADYAQGSGAAASAGTPASFGSEGQMQLSEGLLGHWDMDEIAANTCTGGSNDNCDSSGNGNDGAWNGNATTIGTGKYGNGVTFDGTGDYVNLGDKYDFGANEPFTISVWAKISDDADVKPLFDKRSGADTTWMRFSISQTGAAALELANSYPTNYVGIGTPGTYEDSLWHNFVAWRDSSGNVAIYVDGELKASGTDASFSVANATNTYIGGTVADANASFLGTIDEVRIYNRALSPREVTQLYEWAPGPMAYYNFDEGEGAAVNDLSGNGFNGITNNSPKWVTGKYGGALDFNGSNQNVSVAGYGNSAPTHEITIAFWVNTANTGGTQNVMWLGADTPDRINVHFPWSSGQMFWDFGTCCTPRLTYTPTGYTDTWTHFAVVHSNQGGYMRIYKNGVLELSGTNVGTFARGNYTLYLASAVSTQYLNGSIDEFKIYNYARTSKQIIEDMNAGHPNVGSPVASPLLHYKFDEGYSTPANNSGNGSSTYNGTLRNSPTWSNSGMSGKALSFDGLNDHVGVPYNSSLDYTGTDRSWSLWYRPDSTDSNAGYLISKPWNSSGGYAYNIISSGGSTPVITFALAGATTWSTVTTQTVSADAWHHIAVTIEGSSKAVKIYFDGVLVKTDTHTITSWTPPLGNESLALALGTIYVYGDGWGGDTQYSLKGLMDEVKMYNYTLTSDEVLADYNFAKSASLGSTGTTSAGIADNSSSREYCIPGDTTACSPPIVEWKFDENTGTAANDSSGNAVTGTVTNMEAGDWSSGIKGSALNFDGSTECVQGPNSGNVQLTDGTIEAWIKTSNAGGSYRGIFIKPAAYGMFLRDNLFVIYDWGGGAERSTGVTLNDGKWHHVAVTFDSGTSNGTQMYIDGILRLNTTMTVLNQTYSLSASTGGDPCTTVSQNFTGLIDNAVLFNYERTPAQIMWDYNKGAPVAHYKIDECEGTTVYNSAPTFNDTAAGNNGTLTIGGSGSNTAVGTCSTSGAWADGASGKWNASMDFDGTDDYFTIPAHTAINGNETDAFTVSLWVNPSTSGAARTLVNKQRNTTNELIYAVQINALDTITFTIGKQNVSSAGLIGDMVLSTGTWYMVTAVYDGTNMTIYINGRADTTRTRTLTTATQSLSDVNIGRIYNGTEYFTGKIDDVAIYNYPMTAKQIQTLYNDGAVRFD